MSNSNRPIPTTAQDRSERAFLPLQRDHRLFTLTNDSVELQRIYGFLSVSTPCVSKADCCASRNQYLGPRARQFIDGQCINEQCEWDVTAYSKPDSCGGFNEFM